jgi:acyl carrier protein
MNEDAITEKLRGMNEGNVHDDAAITPDEWDSVDVLDLIAVIDETYNVTVPLEKLNACRTVGELRALIRSTAA